MTDKEKMIKLLKEFNVTYVDQGEYGLIIDDEEHTQSHEEISIIFDEYGNFIAFASY